MGIEDGGQPPHVERNMGEKSEHTLTLEEIRGKKTLELDVKGDFSKALEKLSEVKGAVLSPRQGEAHITIVNPTEASALGQLTEAQYVELMEIQKEVSQGIGVEVKGIGFIDGATASGIRESDKEKKTCFIAFDIPRLQAFRASLRTSKDEALPPKDFHLTLGFVKVGEKDEGDIHMCDTGKKKESGGAIVAPISKKADPELDQYIPLLGDVRYGYFSGDDKEKKPEKTPAPAKEKRTAVVYDGVKLEKALLDFFRDADPDKRGTLTPEMIPDIVKTATTNPNELGKKLGANMVILRPVLEKGK